AILVKGNSPRLYGLDPETGAENLFISDATEDSVSSGSPSYHNGIIYYNTSSHLHAVRATTGEMLWKERSFMNTNSRLNGDIGIDEDNGLLFAADGYYLFAIKMYED
nr:PQQ-like beta-propeller repeat protein [Saprospiraceae bacterium]